MLTHKLLRSISPLLLAAVLAAGCSSTPPVKVATPGTATATAQLTGCLAKAPAAPAGARQVTIARVVDGDTVELAGGEKVRLIGMNTPESVDPRRPVQAFGKEASAYTKQLLEGKQVLLSEGRTPKDKYGRTLGWFWLADGRFVNALLVQQGYAQVYTFSDNPDNAPLLVECQREAREANRGLWAVAEYQDGKQASQMDRGGSSPSSSTPVTITKQPGTVARKGTATVGAKTAPGASCEITVQYKSGPSSAAGLEPKKAGGDGSVSWSWKIGDTTALGTWPVTVTCGGGTAETSVTVK